MKRKDVNNYSLILQRHVAVRNNLLEWRRFPVLARTPDVGVTLEGCFRVRSRILSGGKMAAGGMCGSHVGSSSGGSAAGG